MRQYNPIREALKRLGTARAVYDELKPRAEGAGMTAIEWDWFRARQAEWEPEALEASKKEAARNNALRYARAELTIEDLQMLVAEKGGAAMVAANDAPAKLEAHRAKVRFNELRDALAAILDWYSGDPDDLLSWSDCMRRAHNVLHAPAANPPHTNPDRGTP